jgi:hypothetical protein
VKIVVETIPHSEQRYDTTGDWQYLEDGTLVVKVSRLRHERSEWLVAIHEIVEAFLCRQYGLADAAVTAFDEQFEKQPNPQNIEPGDHPDAPYRDEHCFATAVERMLCAAISYPYSYYEADVYAVSKHG